MAALAPMFASETKAAQLLDMKSAEFRSLVQGGTCCGKDIAGFVRWDVEELRRIIRGDDVGGMRDVQW